MPKIRDEKTGTEELLRDGRYHFAALLADSAAQHLAPPIKQQLEGLKKSAAATADAELSRLEKQALYDRAEYQHDSLHRECELEVLLAVKKNRAAPAYKQVYPQGFMALIALSGAEQERGTKNMIKGLEQALPALAKKYKGQLAKLAAEAAQAEKELRESEAEVTRLFSAEQLSRNELFRQMRRNEGSLLSLFPTDKSRLKLYFRFQPRREKAEPAPAPAPA